MLKCKIIKYTGYDMYGAFNAQGDCLGEFEYPGPLREMLTRYGYEIVEDFFTAVEKIEKLLDERTQLRVRIEEINKELQELIK